MLGVKNIYLLSLSPLVYKVYYMMYHSSWLSLFKLHPRRRRNFNINKDAIIIPNPTLLEDMLTSLTQAMLYT